MKSLIMKPKDKNMEKEYAMPSTNDMEMEKIVVANVNKELRKRLKGLIFVDYYYEKSLMSNIFKIKYVNDSYKFVYMFYDIEMWIADGTFTNNICSEFTSKLRQDILQKYFW